MSITLADIAALAETAAMPPTLDGRQTSAILGCSYWALLDQVKAGTCPVTPLRLGRNLRWPTVLVLQAVGLDYRAADGQMLASPQVSGRVDGTRHAGDA